MIVDLIVIGVIALCTFIGYKQGLIKSAIKILAFFIAIIAAMILYKPVANFVIENTSIDDNIQSTIIQKILPEGVSENEPVEEETKLNLPDMIMENGQNTVKDIAQTMAVKIIEWGSIIIIFIVVRVILIFVTILADLIAKLPIIEQFNKAGGTIYGLVKGIFLVFAVFAVISLVSPMISPDVIKTIDESTISSKIYNNNLLLKIIL